MNKFIVITLSVLTGMARAECPAIDLFGCGAKAQAAAEQAKQQADNEKVYQNKLENAVAIRMGDMQDLMIENNATDACKEEFWPAGDTFKRCVADVDTAYDALKRDLAAGTRKPKNCHEWSVSAGPDWEAARTDMQVNPLGNKKNPVIFGGTVDDGNEGILMVRHESTNVIVKVVPATVVLSDLNIGGHARGYGIQVGKQSIELVSGRITTVPVIEAACLQ
ncbi:hypothetical protein HNQ50_000302 [Silvimonas terrae]|uniref:Uncharacterized protein n=1 Tax=Silvimonas terrae TaxID=300266 RepID=A0A840RB78_9NEIS|nr:hypothetical protein [Silvimonas terrae]MBB5189592.1 hypothetical protein [Silvimonas terrae]